MLVGVWSTWDGVYQVVLHDGHQAELWRRPWPDAISMHAIMRDVPLYRVTDQLAAEGYTEVDLVENDFIGPRRRWLGKTGS